MKKNKKNESKITLIKDRDQKIDFDKYFIKPVESKY